MLPHPAPDVRLEVPFTCMALVFVRQHTGGVGLWRRLDAVDRRILARRSSRYDQPPPQWVSLSPLVAAPLWLVIIPLARAGGWALVPLVAAAIALGLYFAAVIRWDRKHRLQRADEFEIAIDRQ